MDEQTLAVNVTDALRRDFRVHREVSGEHFTGKTFRLDAVVEPLRPQKWKNPEVAMGIEFKSLDKVKGDTKNFTGWYAQCVDYTNTEWEGFGYLPIFVCPSLVRHIPKGLPENHHAVESTLHAVMGKMGLGELRYDDWRGWEFVVYGRHRIWSESEGVEEGATWSLERTFGSR